MEYFFQILWKSSIPSSWLVFTWKVEFWIFPLLLFMQKRCKTMVLFSVENNYFQIKIRSYLYLKIIIPNPVYSQLYFMKIEICGLKEYYTIAQYTLLTKNRPMMHNLKYLFRWNQGLSVTFEALSAKVIPIIYTCNVYVMYAPYAYLRPTYFSIHVLFNAYVCAILFDGKCEISVMYCHE